MRPDPVLYYQQSMDAEWNECALCCLYWVRKQDRVNAGDLLTWFVMCALVVMVLLQQKRQCRYGKAQIFSSSLKAHMQQM